MRLKGPWTQDMSYKSPFSHAFMGMGDRPSAKSPTLFMNDQDLFSAQKYDSLPHILLLFI